MTERAFTAFNGVGIQPADSGGMIAVPPSGRAIPAGRVLQAPKGVVFGPVELQPSGSSTVGLKQLVYRHDRKSIVSGLVPDSTSIGDWLGGGNATAAGLGAVAASERDDQQVDRRTALKLGLVAAGGLALASDNAAASDLPTLDILRMEIEQNPQGLGLTLSDRVAEVLPTGQSYTVTVNGSPISKFGTDGVAVVPQGMTGDVVVSTKPTPSFIDRAQSILASEEVAFEDLSLPQDANHYAEGTRVPITSEIAAVEPVAHAGPEGTIVTLGGQSLPHPSEEDGHEAGEWSLSEDGGTLIYQVGPDPPDAAAVTIRANISSVSETLDDIQR